MHLEHMRRAIAISRESLRARGGPFGAVVARGEEILAEGANAVTATNDPTAHAEVVAIRAACQLLQSFQLTGCDLYTSCEPCPMCFGAIGWARPDRVFYANTRVDAAAIGFDDEFLYAEISKPPESRVIPMTQVLRMEAMSAFEEWSRLENRIDY